MTRLSAERPLGDAESAQPPTEDAGAPGGAATAPYDAPGVTRAERPPLPDTTDVILGSRSGHLRFEALLGTGGMGEVYRGFDELLRRPVAIKVLRDDRRLSKIGRRRFLREARLLSRLRHPNICQVHDYLVGHGDDLLVLELIEGRR